MKKDKNKFIFFVILVLVAYAIGSKLTFFGSLINPSTKVIKYAERVYNPPPNMVVTPNIDVVAGGNYYIAMYSGESTQPGEPVYSWWRSKTAERTHKVYIDGHPLIDHIHGGNIAYELELHSDGRIESQLFNPPSSGKLTRVDVTINKDWNGENWIQFYILADEDYNIDCSSLKSSALTAITTWVNSPTSSNKNNALNAIVEWASNC